MKTYPINLVLKNRLVILLGAEGEITHKIPGLLDVEAKIRVIAPTAADSVKDYARQGKIEWLQREYQSGDLSEAAVVFVSRAYEAIHEAVWEEGTKNGQLVNIMDVVPKCNFHGASLVRQGQLTISIGTGGAAPALAVTLRKRFEKEFGPEYAEFLDYAQSLRPILADRIKSFDQRRAFWYALIESETIAHLRAGNHDLFETEVESLIECYAYESQEPVTI